MHLGSYVCMKNEYRFWVLYSFGWCWDPISPLFMRERERERGADGVALITIINPHANSLSFDVLESLKDHYEQALRRDDVKAIVVTGEIDNSAPLFAFLV